MLRHICRGLAVILIVALLMILSAVSVLAFDARSGMAVTVASGEVVDDDLYVAAETIIIDGTVDGDLWAAGNTITVNGIVNGSVMAAGMIVNINGDIAHAVRAVAETININGDVGGDVITGCGNVNIVSTARVGGDLLFGADIAGIDGLIEGNIKGTGSEVTISNGVNGNIELKVESLTISSTANIGGDLSYTSEEEADIQSGAQIAGGTTHTLPEVKPEVKKDWTKVFPFVLFFGVLAKVLNFLMALVTGVVIIFLVPKKLTSITDAIGTRPGPSAGWGAMILFLTPIAALIVCFTIIGIPVGLITLALYGTALYLAQIPVGLFIGRWIIGRFRVVEGKAIMVGALAVGLAILKLLSLIPYFSFFVGFVVVLFGLGAVVAAERKRRAETREAASA
jgi:cytoskeletal protein CcmA (bactofilin family)